LSGHFTFGEDVDFAPMPSLVLERFGASKAERRLMREIRMKDYGRYTGRLKFPKLL
jgi:hypothetical protein